MTKAQEKEIEELNKPFPWEKPRPEFVPMLVCPGCNTDHDGKIGSEQDIRLQIDAFKTAHGIRS